MDKENRKLLIIEEGLKNHNAHFYTWIKAIRKINMEAGVDVLWIGARTTVNPFSVQEIADAIQGVDIPVIVKNPINPDFNLWVGALERIADAGITKLAAMHRGFSFYGGRYATFL